MNETTIAIDHRKVVVRTRPNAKGNLVLSILRDAGAANLTDRTLQCVGAAIRRQCNRAGFCLVSRENFEALRLAGQG